MYSIYKNNYIKYISILLVLTLVLSSCGNIVKRENIDQKAKLKKEKEEKDKKVEELKKEIEEEKKKKVKEETPGGATSNTTGTSEATETNTTGTSEATETNTTAISKATVTNATATGNKGESGSKGHEKKENEEEKEEDQDTNNENREESKISKWESLKNWTKNWWNKTKNGDIRSLTTSEIITDGVISTAGVAATVYGIEKIYIKYIFNKEMSKKSIDDLKEDLEACKKNKQQLERRLEPYKNEKQELEKKQKARHKKKPFNQTRRIDEEIRWINEQKGWANERIRILTKWLKKRKMTEEEINALLISGGCNVVLTPANNNNMITREMDRTLQRNIHNNQAIVTTTQQPPIGRTEINRGNTQAQDTRPWNQLSPYERALVIANPRIANPQIANPGWRPMETAETADEITCDQRYTPREKCQKFIQLIKDPTLKEEDYNGAIVYLQTHDGEIEEDEEKEIKKAREERKKKAQEEGKKKEEELDRQLIKRLKEDEGDTQERNNDLTQKTLETTNNNTRETAGEIIRNRKYTNLQICEKLIKLIKDPAMPEEDCNQALDHLHLLENRLLLLLLSNNEQNELKEAKSKRCKKLLELIKDPATPEEDCNQAFDLLHLLSNYQLLSDDEQDELKKYKKNLIYKRTNNQ